MTAKATWKLGRVKQCKKCPWKVSTNPDEIPDGYSREAHRALECTIAKSNSPFGGVTAMSCHEHPVREEVHCIGWLSNQLGPGNNIPMRMRMFNCENAAAITTVGRQHRSFEDTLP